MAPLIATSRDHNALVLLRKCTHCEAAKTPQCGGNVRFGPYGLVLHCGIFVATQCVHFLTSTKSLWSPEAAISSAFVFSLWTLKVFGSWPQFESQANFLKTLPYWR